MFQPRAFPIIDAFAAGKAAEGAGVPMSANPFPPGTLDHTQWLIGYQWGSDRPRPKQGGVWRSVIARLRAATGKR